MPEDYSKGLTAISSGDYVSAIKFFHRITVEHKDDFYGYYYLAGALFQTGEYQQAIDALGWAIYIDPNNAQARYNRALALEKLERYSEAIVGIRDALTLQPQYPQAQQALVRLQARTFTPGVPVTGVTATVSLQSPIGSNTTQVISAVQPSAVVTPSSRFPVNPQLGSYPRSKNPLLSSRVLEIEEISLIDAFGNLRDALLSPRTYLTGQAKYGGFMAPFWMYVALKLLGLMFGTLGSMAGSGQVVTSGGMGDLYGSVHNLLSSICSWTYPLWFASTLAMFGLFAAKRKDFSGYLRIAVTSSVPVIAGMALLGLVIPIVAPKPLAVASSAAGTQSYLGAYGASTPPQQQYAGGRSGYGMQQYPQGTSQYSATNPETGSGGSTGQNSQVRSQLNNLEGQLGQMAASMKSIPAAPLWLVVPLLILQVGLLGWYCVVVVMGCKFLLGTSNGAAAVIGVGTLVVYLGSTVLVYLATKSFMNGLYGALKSHGSMASGFGQGGM